ncbi:hypothetical protein APUTEX25_004742 [Auxenochlorella protothecoides]|nr:hypothetical protein APUTEX25_004742 [Auxenochlorella protothecoides]|eukprot:RMZ56385.1 hypothetical protein APUTEX25_004742 [Auxenochlorella protothecoides]
MGSRRPGRNISRLTSPSCMGMTSYWECVCSASHCGSLKPPGIWWPSWLDLTSQTSRRTC